MKKLSKNILFTGMLLALFMVLGFAIDKFHNINILYKSFGHIVLTLISFLAFTYLFYLLIYGIFKLLDNQKEPVYKTKIGNFIFNKHPILSLFLIFFMVGIPILIMYYPGPIHWDGLQQLNYFYGVHQWTNHHPVVPTILMGLCVKLGRFLVNDNFGAFIFNFLQYIFSCFVFAYTLKFLKDIKTPKWLLLGIFIFFLINPVWYINGYTLVKDTLFYLFFMLFLIEFIKYLYSDKKWPLILSSIPVILFRNNGIHIIILSLLVVGFFRKDKRRLNLILIIACLLFQFLYNQTIAFFDIPQSNIREMLSIPIQQTARYIKNYDLTKKEREVYQSIFVMSMDDIKEKYDPELSDPVKFSFYANSENLVPYFQTWFKDFLKHPKVYFDAFLENYYGYIYPPKRDFKDGIAWFIVVDNNKVNTGYFNFAMAKKYKKARKGFEKGLKAVRKTPGIDLLFNTGFYTFILIIMISYAVHLKKYEYILASSPIIFALLFCFLSPVNAYVRYMNPIIVTVPIFIGLVNNRLKNKQSKKD